MGGSVGLKGTDGDEILREAEKRGAKRLSPERARKALAGLRSRKVPVEFLTCSGDMGKSELDSAGIPAEVVFEPGPVTTRLDTARAVMEFVKRDADLILFAGGDGTARDILKVVGQKVPMVGIPTGVKMHSAVFAYTPEDVVDLVLTYEERRSTKDADVMDVDEESLRAGKLRTSLFGVARVPDDPIHIQSGKAVYHSGSAEDELDELGQYVAETMEAGVLYILGPGSTTEAIAKHLGLEKTLLGVDVILDMNMILRDAAEADLLKLLAGNRVARIVVSPIGAQGLIFGRGNQQLSPSVIRTVGRDNVLIVSTPSKLKGTPVLRCDTGDPGLDVEFRGRIKVLTGFKRRKLMTVE
jgi:predicted polyphosphate/ATP-dependent NAD kinase